MLSFWGQTLFPRGARLTFKMTSTYVRQRERGMAPVKRTTWFLRQRDNSPVVHVDIVIEDTEYQYWQLAMLTTRVSPTCPWQYRYQWPRPVKVVARIMCFTNITCCCYCKCQTPQKIEKKIETRQQTRPKRFCLHFFHGEGQDKQRTTTKTKTKTKAVKYKIVEEVTKRP